jgi:hypothetical protein
MCGSAYLNQPRGDAVIFAREYLPLSLNQVGSAHVLLSLVRQKEIAKMIFSFLLKRLFLLLLFAVVFTSPDIANAQCPEGKPPNSDGSCGKPGKNKPAKNKPAATPTKLERTREVSTRPNNNVIAAGSRNNAVTNNCSIDVRVTKLGGEPLAAVNLMLDNSILNIGVTDAEGAFKFKNLPCKRSYKITPGHAKFIFNVSSATITNLTNNESAAFVASTREKIVPEAIIASTREKIVAKEEIRSCNPPPTYLQPPKIKFGESLTGKLNPKTSFCDEKTKRYFQSYQLDGALGGDIIQFDLQSASDMIIQVTDQTGKPVTIGPEGESDDPASRQLVLPIAGDYSFRVIDRSNLPSDYRLSVTRKGLTDEGYNSQLNRAYTYIAEPGKPTFFSSLNSHLERITPFTGKASEQKINDAIAILERMREMAPNKPEAISMLAAIQLYLRKDLVAGRELATKAIELGGEARFRVNYGVKLDKDLRRISDGNHPCWLIISKDKIACESFNPKEGEVFTSNPELMANKSIDVSNYYLGFSIYGKGKKMSKIDKREIEVDEVDSFYFIPLSLSDMNTKFSLTESTTIKNLIRQFVPVKQQ